MIELDCDDDGSLPLLTTPRGTQVNAWDRFTRAEQVGGYLRGESAASGAGWKVGFAWDPFGDGYDDALVGAYGYDFGGFAAGAVYRTRGGSW